MPGKDDDQDLADLLPVDVDGGSETVPLNLDKTKFENGNGAGAPAKTSFNPCCGLCSLISAHLSYLCFAYPSACGCCFCVIALVVVAVLVTNMVNPTLKFGDVQHDWTTVSSAYELDIAKIDHWCLGGGNEGCRCEDPLQPASRVELRSWTEAFKENKQQIAKYMDDHLIMADLDVAIIGESAIEEMDGRWMGRRPDDQLKTIGSIFKTHFAKDKGAPVEGVALGVAGDSANNVLWRLMHGEMPPGFEPKIWWVHVGMNDLTRQQCSEEVVVLGVLRVVEEILNKRPKARVVINSLLPMADLRGGTIVTDRDYKDAFNTYRGKRQSGTGTVHYVRKKIDGREQIVPASSLNKDGDKPKKKAGGGRHHNRRLLEEALEAYNVNTNDNSELIERLQQELEQGFDGVEVEEVFEEDSIVEVDEYDETTVDFPHRMLDNGPRRRLQDDPRKRMKREKRDRYNPTINRMQRKQKKYNFFRNRRMPLWTAIYAINKQLFKFCEKHDRVMFFDATNIFAERQSDGKERYFTLLSDNISARGHPTEVGYSKWEDAMVKKVQQILKQMKEESPELFMAPAPVGSAPVGGGGGSGGAALPNEVERLEKKPMVTENRGEEMAPPPAEEPTDDHEGADTPAVGAKGGEDDENAEQQPAAGSAPQFANQYSRPETSQYGGVAQPGTIGTGTGGSSGLVSAKKKKKKKKKKTLGTSSSGLPTGGTETSIGASSNQYGGFTGGPQTSGVPMQGDETGMAQPGGQQMSGFPMQPEVGSVSVSKKKKKKKKKQLGTVGTSSMGGLTGGDEQMSGGPMQSGTGEMPMQEEGTVPMQPRVPMQPASGLTGSEGGETGEAETVGTEEGNAAEEAEGDANGVDAEEEGDATAVVAAAAPGTAEEGDADEEGESETADGGAGAAQEAVGGEEGGEEEEGDGEAAEADNADGGAAAATDEGEEAGDGGAGDEGDDDNAEE